MNVRMVVALNMYDHLEESGNQLDYRLLGRLLGVPMAPTVAKKNLGIDHLFRIVINLYEGTDFPDNAYRHIHINHGPELEKAIEILKDAVSENEDIRHKYSTRFLSIKLLENDNDVEGLIRRMPNGEDILEKRDKLAHRIHELTKEDTESAITDAKYGFISGALRETYTDNHQEQKQTTKVLDAIVTHRFWGFPIFFLFMYLMFESTFVLGGYPMDGIEWLVGALGNLIHEHMNEGQLKDLLIDGVIGGVGGVIVFLPNILILYFFISLMEDSGYMARAAFIMDKIMHKMGLHGKSFIPLIMGFGCNVPAIMASRTIENRKSRLITMLINPLMSCSARLPIYLLLAGAFFPGKESLTLLSLYSMYGGRWTSQSAYGMEAVPLQTGYHRP